MKILSEMLTYRRAHDSAGEAEFIARYIQPVAPEVIAAKDGTIHAFVRAIPMANGQPSNIVFAAHTDSVHNRQLTATRQPVGFDSARGEFFVSAVKQRDCLGADDAAGCYVLSQMIASNVPGLYIFFRGEERGGIGSSYVARHRADLFDNIDCAIQFDRRGTHSIITEMACGRTCSDAFANSLSSVLGMGHACDNTGSFTDTANLADIISECTNISIGYECEHSARETLNAAYVFQLTAAFIRAFKKGTPTLTIERVAGDFSNNEEWELSDMDDRDIFDFVYSSDRETLARVLISARDRMFDLEWETPHVR